MPNTVSTPAATKHAVSAIRRRLADGLKWRSGERQRTETELDKWMGKRAQAGAFPPPHGFPKPPKFDRVV